MPFAAALSVLPDCDRAIEEVCAAAAIQEPDLALVFFSPHHQTAADRLGAALRRRLRPRCLLGCVGESILANGREVEDGPAISLWLARWEGSVQAETFRLTFEKTAEGPAILGWPDGLQAADPARSVMLLLGDPMTFPAPAFLKEMNTTHRGLRVLGGMASGGRDGGWPLLRDDEAHDEGAVGVLLHGDIRLRSIVSQGCRPIGRHYVVTKAQENFIQELGGRPVMEQLQELWDSLSPREQELFQQGLHIGLVMNEYQGEFQRGDFLVRNVMGIERQSGSLAITDRVRVGQTVQFHVRDAETADEDLRTLLQLDREAHQRRASAALVFSCNGRGTRMFPAPDHDVRCVRAEAGEVPLAGFFAAGELGPVGDQNFIHGFTASVALFE